MPKQLSTADLERANIPPRYWQGVSLSRIPTTAMHRAPVLQYFRQFEVMQQEGVGLYLWSKTNGTGKTAIACIAAMHALAAHRSVFYYRSEDLKDATIDHTAFDGTTTVYDRARDVDFLVLDDLGREYKGQSNFVQSVIENLVRERVQRLRVTCVTSNLSPGALKDFFPIALVDVMKEAFVNVQVADPDQGGVLWREARRAQLKDLLAGNA